MVRLLFVASLLLIAGKLIFRQGRSASDFSVTAPAFTPLGTGSVRITMSSSTGSALFLQRCDIRTRVVVERRIAGAWYTHRRLVRGNCDYDRNSSRDVGRRTNTRLPLTMPGEYRLLVFFYPDRHDKPRTALSNAFEVKASRVTTTLAGTAATP